MGVPIPEFRQHDEIWILAEKRLPRLNRRFVTVLSKGGGKPLKFSRPLQSKEIWSMKNQIMPSKRRPFVLVLEIVRWVPRLKDGRKFASRNAFGGSRIGGRFLGEQRRNEQKRNRKWNWSEVHVYVSPKIVHLSCTGILFHREAVSEGSRLYLLYFGDEE